MGALRLNRFPGIIQINPAMRADLHELKIAVLLLALAGGMAATRAQQLPPTTDVLTNAAQIRALTAARAAQSLPVHLRGVVIYDADPPQRAVVLADQTAGIYLLADKNLFTACHRKDLLEVEGVTDPGQFAPIVKVRNMRKVGTGPIPPPRRVSYQELITGSLDGQWVEFSGVVRHCLEPAKKGDIWRAFIAANGGVVSVRCSMPRDPLIQEDAEVLVQAVCLYQFNQKRQVLTPVLQLPAGVKLQVEKTAPANMFTMPRRPANSLLLFSPDNPSGHRVHVGGVVTYAQSGSLFWIRDATCGLRIQTRQSEELKPGDELEVLGFPAYNSPPPMLEDAIFRKTGTNRPPQPIFLASAAKAFDYEDDLIATEATLTDVQPVLEGTALTLNDEGTIFKAILKRRPDFNHNLDWQPGGRVRVSGICSVIHDDVRPMMGIWQPQSFQILLRSPSDLVVITRPPWWTAGHVILLLGMALGGLLLATGVVTLLARRRLHEQERQRAMAEAEFTAILSERNRLAREIHDTLAQGLVATSVQLRLAKKHAANSPEALHQHLDTAQQLVRGSLEEARNSIWNMRSQVLETGDLADALKNILVQMAHGTDMKTSFEVTGNPRRLAPVVETNLLRAGQEAITNAIKHSQAGQVSVRLEFAEKQFRLVVTDDGRGFEPASPQSGGGGFGLVGMRERAAVLKGKLNIRSAPGQGAEVSLSVPL